MLCSQMSIFLIIKNVAESLDVILSFFNYYFALFI